MNYQSRIAEELARRGIDGIDPRHIEAYMRVEHGTLDHLSRAAFAREVLICVECVREGGTDAAEANALSFAL